MKLLVAAAAVLLAFFTGCSEEENLKLEAYNAEAFAFDIGDMYEVNATVRIRGFRLDKKGEKFVSTLNYSIDLVKPDGKTVGGIVADTEDFMFPEEVNDTGLDIQFELDSTYHPGKYTVILKVEDNFTRGTSSTSAEFTLE